MSNEKFNGSIELISGITQKNNGDFPLVEASAVAFYEPVLDESGQPTEEIQEIRLPEKINKMGISPEQKEELVEKAVDAVFNNEKYLKIDNTLFKDDVDDVNDNVVARTKALETNVSAVFNSINSLDAKIDNVALNAGKDNKELRLQYEEKESILYLYADLDNEGLQKPDENGEGGNVIAQTNITGGGGGTGSNKVFSIRRKENSKSSWTTLLGSSAEVAFFAKLAKKEDGREETVDEELTFKLTVEYESKSEKTFTTTFNRVTNQDHSIDVTPYLKLGTNKITISAVYVDEIDSDEGKIPIRLVSNTTWSIKTINLSLISEFNDEGVYNTGLTWRGNAFGDIRKTIHFKLDDQDDWRTIENVLGNGEQVDMSIPLQSHGNHTLVVYATAYLVDSDETIKSNELHYNLLFVDEKNPTPVMRLNISPVPLKQYSPGNISFTVYDSQNPKKRVLLTEGEDNILFSGEKDNTVENIPYTFLTHGQKTITLSYPDGGIDPVVVNINVQEAAYQIAPITSGLTLDFLPTGRSNSAEDYNIFYNNAEKVVSEEDAAGLPDIDWTLSENFDWNNGGWQKDEKNNVYFCVKAGTTATIHYDPFKSSTIISNGKSAGSGREFKLIFKTANVSDANATFLTCLDDSNIGIKMNVHEAYINSNENQIYSPYSENDLIEFDVNIFPGNNNGTEILPVGNIIPMTMTYEDGTPFQPSVHTISTSYEHKNATPSSIVIGSNDCDIHIYRMKVYNRYLTDKEILSNFVADARDGDEMIKRYERNLIYNADTTLTPESLAAARPDLKIIKITCPVFTKKKSDFKPLTSVEMIHKNGDPQKDNWKFEDCFIVGQGTTSDNYGDGARNLEFICCFDGEYKNKKILEDYYGGDSSQYYSHRTKLTLNPNDPDPSKRVDNSYDATLEENPGDGKISLHEKAYPNNYFNVKVNMASSENANNALQANRYDRYMPYKTPAQKRDSRIKTTMDFVNCVIFLCETSPSGIIFPPATEISEPEDKDYHFYALGNIGDSKKTDGDRVYTIGDEANEFVVEIMDNDKPNAAFPTGYTHKIGERTEFIYPIAREQWEATNGYIKVTNENELIKENLPIFYEYKDGTYVKTEDTSIDSSKTYYEINYLNSAYKTLYVDKFRLTEKGIVQDSGWLASYEMRYGEDSSKNIKIWNDFYEWLIFSSNEEFKAELGNWFIQNSALYYYLFTERYTMMDNRAKNSFWHWAKHYITEEEAAALGESAKYYIIDNEAAMINGGYRFDFWDYDNDTALGIDNNGKMKFSYGLEDTDLNEADKTFVFNAGNSVFFRRIGENFSSELTTIYGSTVKDETWDPNHLINEYDNWQAEFPEALWIEDAEYKYYRPYRNAILKAPDLGAGSWQTGHLINRFQGRKKYHRRQWERDQADYMDSKYGTLRAANKNLLLRCKTPPESAVDADYTWHLRPYKKVYLRTYRGAELQDIKRAVDLTKTYDLVGSTTAIQDAQLQVYSANCIQDFGDMSPFYAYTVEVAAAEKVKNLTLGNATPGYKNDPLDKAVINTATILQELNIRNLRKLTSVALGSSLKKLEAQGSGLTSATFSAGGSIREAYLPNTITEIVGRDLYYLHTLEIEGVQNLKAVIMDNCKEIINTDYFKNMVCEATQYKLNSTDARVHLTDIDWTLDSPDAIEAIYNCKGETSEVNSYLSGKIYLTGKVTQTNYDKYHARWPKLTISVSDESNIIQQKLVQFYSGSSSSEPGEKLAEFLVNVGSYLYKQYYDENTQEIIETYDPTYAGNLSGVLINPPEKANSKDGKFTYNYTHWLSQDKIAFTEYTKNNNTDMPVTKELQFYAQYSEVPRTYRVKWQNGDGSTIVTWPSIKIGESIDYETAMQTINPGIDIFYPTKAAMGNIYYLFTGWEQSTSIIIPTLKADGSDFEDDIIVIPKFDSANGSNVKGDSMSYSATDIYATAQNSPSRLNSTAAEGDDDYTFHLDYSAGQDKIQIQLGYMPSYKDIPYDIIVGEEEIDPTTIKDATPKMKKPLTGFTELICNGSSVTAGRVKPFEKGESFTIAIDFTPAYNASKGTLVSLYEPTIPGSEAYGFRLSVGETIDNIAASPLAKWGYRSNENYYIPKGVKNRAAKQTITDVKNPELTYREIMVIRKIAGDPKLYIYTHDRYSFDDGPSVQILEGDSRDVSIIKDETVKAAIQNIQLRFGGEIENSLATNTAAGTIHHARIWWADLGEIECKKICNWTYEKMNFVYSNSKANGKYEARSKYASGNKCVASFLAEDLLPGRLTFNNRNPFNYHDSQLKNWLNGKFLKALPKDWQLVINPVAVTACGGMTEVDGVEEFSRSVVRTEYDKIYIPAAIDLDTSLTEQYLRNESEQNNVVPYPQLAADINRIKTLPNTNGTHMYWPTRSVHSNTTDVYRASVLISDPNGGGYPADQNGGKLGYRQKYKKGSSTESVNFTNDTLYGILVGFSI